MVALIATLLAAGHVALPGGPPVGMDYLAFDAATSRLWVPAGNTGRVDVIDTRTGKLEAIEGNATKEQGRRKLGPSSASVGDGVVYVGNRGDASICAFDAKTLKKQGCATLESSPDGVQYVSTTKEIWITTPNDKSITILDAKEAGAPKASGKIALEGDPEGYAIDAARGVYYTNLEDGDRTLAIDVKSRKVTATWDPRCGGRGPRGLALDEQHRHLFVACNAGSVKSLDAGKDGAVLSSAATGEGLDNIDFLPSKHLVFAAAGVDGKLTVLKAADDGKLSVARTVETVEGGRTVIVDDKGNAYIPDSKGGRLFVVEAQK